MHNDYVSAMIIMRQQVTELVRSPRLSSSILFGSTHHRAHPTLGRVVRIAEDHDTEARFGPVFLENGPGSGDRSTVPLT